jgi:hypothetical protein
MSIKKPNILTKYEMSSGLPEAPRNMLVNLWSISKTQ